MRRLIWYVLIAGVALLGLFNSAVLELLGWHYLSANASNFTKIHPSSYIFLIGAGLVLFSVDRRAWTLATSPRFLLFGAASLILLLRSAVIALAGVTGGEVSAVIVTFLTPALILLCFEGVEPADLRKLQLPVRIYFVVNSVMAIGERLIGHRFIPSVLDLTQDDRASALVGHPLNGSLLTGLLITYLVTARRAEASVASRLPEIVLHAAAMFAFGGRSALVFTPVVLVLSAVLGRQRQGLARLSSLQRALPLLIVAIGVVLIFLPIPFVDQTLDRFTQDAHSSETRNSAVLMIDMLSPQELLGGVDSNRRTILMGFFHSNYGIELAWVALMITYGLVATLPMAVALPFLMIRTAQRLDRSAFYMTILFLVATAGALSFGVKSLGISMAFVMMLTLCQPLPRTSRRGTGDGALDSILAPRRMPTDNPAVSRTPT